MSGEFRLASHQVYAERMMECNESLGIFYAAGTGKTMIALSFAYHAVERGDASSVLVVCPASLVGNWRASVDRMTEFEGYTEEGVARLRDALLVTSYSRLYTRRAKGEARRREVPLREEVDRPWDVLITDEAHCHGRHDSTQTKACIAIARMSGRRYALTGTPVGGGGGGPDYQKLYGICSVLEPGRWTWTEWKRRYVKREDKWFKPVAYDDGACEALMRDCAISVRLEDCVDLPSEMHDTVECGLLARKPYDDISKGRTKDYDVEIRTAGGRYPKLLQLCSGSLRTEEGTLEYDCSKDAALGDVLDGTDDCVVVFCNYTASVDRCMRVCAAHGRTAVRYDGSAKADDWMRFRDGEADVIVCQYQKGGVGIDLYRSATTVFYEPCWSHLLLTQARARTMRRGQTRPCRYWYLRTPGTREADAWDAVLDGMELTDALFERWAVEDGFA